MSAGTPAPQRRDLILAAVLAVLFTLAWALRDWANLSQLRLPDTDDAMRLQQIRDWLAGQAWSDLTQYRLAGGLPMHWSRLADLVPGGLILGLTPLIGRHAAEVAAVLLWPGLLFAAALLLVARIARVMLAPVPVAILIAALAFPATGQFLPGRIDHHGLQLVLLLGIVAAMLHPRGFVSGAWLGGLSVVSLVIGLETAPFVLLAIALVVLGWIAERAGASRHLIALAGTYLAALGAARLALAPAAFAYPACDGFTATAFDAALAGGWALALLAMLDGSVAGRGPRLLLAGAVGGLAILAVDIVAPGCFRPYGGVDPALAARWLSKVGEAQPLFAAPLATVIGQCGLLFAGLAASIWALRRTRDPGWAILLLFQLAALAITLAQLRGASAGALLAAPALAMLVSAARARGALATTAAWLASAGILYPLAARAVPPPAASADLPQCAGPAALAALAALPPGLVAGPIDLGAWGVAATRHSFVAGPYHRNNAGNAAALAILDGPARPALARAATWRVRYLAVCDAGPGWWRGRLVPLVRAGGLTVYAFPRLPAPAPAP